MAEVIPVKIFYDGWQIVDRILGCMLGKVKVTGKIVCVCVDDGELFTVNTAVR